MQVALPVRTPALPPPTADRAMSPVAATAAPPLNLTAAVPASPRPLTGSNGEDGLLFKVVVKTFARLTQTSADGSSVEAVAKQKVKIELEIEDDGDVSLQIDVKSKVRVRGLSGEEAAAAASGLMDAMRAFTASLFSTLKELLAPAAPDPLPAAGASSLPTRPAAAAPVTTPAPAATAGAAASTPAAGIDTAAATTDDTPATGSADAAPASPPSSPSFGSLSSRLRLQAAYVTMDMRVALLVDALRHSDRSASSPDDARGNTLAQLRSRFEAVATRLRPDNPPSLTDFLQALATQDRGSGAGLALPLQATGGLVATQA